MTEKKRIDNINVECLLSGSEECEFRMLLKKLFEYDIEPSCPYRKMLKRFYEDIKAREKQ